MENHVKLERTRLNMSQEVLAAALGVSRQTIHSIETGKFNPTVVLAIKMARLFQVKVEELFVVEE